MAQSGVMALPWPLSLQLPFLLLFVLLAINTINITATATSTATTYRALENDFSDDYMMQIVLGQFQLDLAPTPEPLTDVDNVLGRSIERVVQRELERLFSDSFEYMYVAGIDNVNIKTQAPSTSTDTTTTSVLYNGGVVAFDSPPSSDVAAVVQASIESYLREELVAHGETWALIERVTYIDLAAAATANNNDNSPSQSMTQVPTQTRSSSTGDVSAVQGQETSSTVQSEERSTEKIVASGFGIAFVLIGAILFVKVFSKRSNVHDVSMSLEEADGRDDKPIDTNNPGHSQGPTSSLYRDGMVLPGAYVFEDKDDEEEGETEGEEEDRSQMAQYSSGGDCPDSTSVGPSVTSSDFTLATMDDGTYSALADGSIGRQSPNTHLHPDALSSRVAVMGFASAETFERDRLVTLHKDILQSEWGGLSSSPATITYAAGAAATPAIVSATRSTPPSLASVSFEQAYQEDEDEQGEEVYILPETGRQARRQDNDGDDDNVVA